MALHVPPVITKVELEMAAVPEEGETVEDLAARLAVKGYGIVRIEHDRVVLINTVEEP